MSSEIKLPGVFQNEAGVIQNLLELPTGGVNGVSVIQSRGGARRSSHWHKQDAHYLYVLSGVCDYWSRPVGSTEPPTHERFRTGQMFFTGPGIEHWTYFPEPTFMLSMSNRPRDAKSHEDDVVRVEWLPEVGE